MKKTVKYTKTKHRPPSNFISITPRNTTRQWKKEIETDNYIIGELPYSAYEHNTQFYTNFFSGLIGKRKNKERDVKIYEWKEFLIFLFSIYQKTANRKLLPREKARAIKAFLEDFNLNVARTDLDHKFNLSKKADKSFYIKRGNKTYLLGFLIGKKLFITFSHILNYFVDRYFNLHPNGTKINNLHHYLLHLIYKEWGVEIKTKKTKEKIVIGADPEFLIYNKCKQNPKIADYQRLKPAHQIISSGHENDELGLDGFNTLGELRPSPSISPYTLTRNIKGLFNKFYSEYGSSHFLETGGGCEHSLGGHIHLGHENFKNLSQAEVRPLTQLLDAFLYYPIKLNMYGAVREWKDFNELDVSIDYDSGECRIEENPEQIIKTIKKVKPIKSQQFNGFDAKSMTRSQPHGLEYRSLPSFIGDFTFTKLVLKLAQGIAEKYVDLKTQGVEFTYNDPPQKEDYLVFLKEKEVNQLFEYLYGKKRDLFLKNTLENWKVIKQFYVTISDSLNIFNWLNLDESPRTLNSEFETKFTRDYQSVLKDINHSLKIMLLPSRHYFRTSRFRTLAHPFFLITPHVNFSTLTEDEFATLVNRPDPYTIYIGIPQLWRDRDYITKDKKNITKIIADSIYIFQLYHKKRNSFKVNQTLADLKKNALYNYLRLAQIAEEIKEYSKCFKKHKKKQKKDTPVRASMVDSFDERVRVAETFTVGAEMPTSNTFYLPDPDEANTG